MSKPSVLLVPQAFKGTLPASEVAAAMAAGVIDAGANPQIVVGSDGGDGLIEALGPAVTQTTAVSVTGPLGRQIDARIVWLDNRVAVIESRLICGLSLLSPAERDPTRATSKGVGEAMLRAVADGATSIVVGLGGSAMVDGGWGMASALGWEFSNSDGAMLVPGRDRMGDVSSVQGLMEFKGAVTALCDVSVPFLGSSGAVLFAAQKGADAVEQARLERDIDRFVGLRQEWARLARLPGAGAAGGLGFGLAAFAGGRLVAGADWVLRRTRFAEFLVGATLVATAEGRFDSTSLLGKLTGTVIRRAAEADVPALVLTPGTDGAGHGIPGLTVVSGGDEWSVRDVERNTRDAVGEALSLLGS